MKIVKFADLVLEALGRNDQDFSVDRRDVIVMAETVISGIVGQLVEAGREIPDGFYTSIKYPITVDQESSLSMVVLDKPGILNLANNAGIKSFGPIGEPWVQFIFLRDGQLNSIGDLEVNTLGGKTGGWVTENKIYLFQPNPNLQFLLVKGIPNISELDEDTDYMNSDQVQTMVFDAVVARLGYKAQKPEDKTNDNKTS